MAFAGYQRLRRDFGLEGQLPGCGAIRRLIQVSMDHAPESA